jgi:DNA-binding transcriptional regulator YbjK
MTADIARLESTARARFAAGDIPKSELVTALLQTNAAALARHEVMAQIQRAVGDLESALQVPSNLPDAAWRTAPIR